MTHVIEWLRADDEFGMPRWHSTVLLIGMLLLFGGFVVAGLLSAYERGPQLTGERKCVALCEGQGLKVQKYSPGYAAFHDTECICFKP